MVPDLSDIEMQESSDLLLLVKVPGIGLHLTDDHHVAIVLEEVLPRHCHLPTGILLQAMQPVRVILGGGNIMLLFNLQFCESDGLGFKDSSHTHTHTHTHTHRLTHR